MPYETPIGELEYKWRGNELWSYPLQGTPWYRDRQKEKVAERDEEGRVRWFRMPTKYMLQSAGLGPDDQWTYADKTYRGWEALPIDPETGKALDVSIQEQVMQKWREFETEQKERYAKALGVQSEMEARVRGAAGGLGEQEERDIRTGYRSLAAGGYGDLVQRGMAGTSLVGGMEAGTYDKMMQALGRSRETRRKEKKATELELGTSRIGLYERRKTYPPEMSQYTMLMQQLGRLPGYGGYYAGAP